MVCLNIESLIFIECLNSEFFFKKHSEQDTVHTAQHDRTHCALFTFKDL